MCVQPGYSVATGILQPLFALHRLCHVLRVLLALLVVCTCRVRDTCACN